MNTPVSFVPELLSPAGSLKNMRFAFAYGADAVYAGQPRYSLRVRNNEFSLDNLKIGIDEAHALGKKFYVVSNISPHNGKVKTYIHDIAPVIAMKPDAIIMSDPGLIMLVREKWPEMPIHLSVQANAVNYATVQFWAQQGIERVILSRELAVKEIDEIRQHCPDMELEVFVHGALCMAYSGRCLLSGYINKRDPNQGACTNACRWTYSATPAEQNETGDIVKIENPNRENEIEPTLGEGQPTNNVYLLNEAGRPDEDMPAFEDEHGTYIMNSKDLRAIEHVDALTKIGVHSLKIEGRTKSFYYVARTAQVYRKAIDNAVAGKPFDPSLYYELENLAHRGYTDGFLQRHRHSDYQNYDQGASVSTQQQMVGEVLELVSNKWIKIEVKNKFLVGNVLQIMTPAGNLDFTLSAMFDKAGNSIKDAKGSGHIVTIPLPELITQEQRQSIAKFGILLRYLNSDEDTRNIKCTNVS